MYRIDTIETIISMRYVVHNVPDLGRIGRPIEY